jgi:hypothetical protein
MTLNYSYTKHQRMKKSAPQEMQAAIKMSESKTWISGQSKVKTTAINSLPTSRSHHRFTDEDIFLPPLTSLLKKKWARAASCKSIFSLVASSNDINTGGRIGMDRAQESEVLMGRDPGGSIRHSAQNSDITRKERQAAISRQQVTNITKMFEKMIK